MNFTILPCCYFPTTVILIDSDLKFLEKVKAQLNPTHMLPKLYDDPMRVLTYVHSRYRLDPFTQRCLERPEEDERDHPKIEINLNAIAEEAYNSHRFSEISVLIVNYAMTGMNGVDFFKSLTRFPFKKILLVDNAEAATLMKVFNEGIIDQFVQKDHPQFATMLNQAIFECQIKYFQDLSTIIVDSLTHDPSRSPTCINDPAFIDFFSKLCAQENILEYYLTDSCGSYLLINSKGYPSILAVKNDQEMQACYETAQYSDFEVPATVLEALKNRQKILYLHNPKDFHRSPDFWDKYLYLAQTIKGRETYYYAHIKDTQSYELNPHKLASFANYVGDFEI